MKLGNPCCCCTLQTGAKVIAIVNIILVILGVLSLVLQMLGVGAAVSEYNAVHREQFGGESHNGSGVVVGFALIVTIVVIIVYAFFLIVSIVLYLGARDRSYGKVKFWFIVAIVMTVLSVLSLFGGGKAAAELGVTIISILIFIYEIWVVYAFMQELQTAVPAGEAGYVHAKQNEEA